MSKQLNGRRMTLDAPAQALGRTKALDAPAGMYRDLVRKALPPGPVRDALHGVWLGHPLHPVLVQLPIGAFLSTVILDWLPGERRDADTLLAAGLLATVPAVVSGATDYSEGHEEQQRVGLVHAAANSVATGFYLVSLVQRRQGKRRAGKLTALAGLGISGAAAALGGHLSFTTAMGANHATRTAHVTPEEPTDVGALESFVEGEPVRAMVGTVPVLVVREGLGVHVLADECSHADGPLHEGEISTNDRGQLCVTCPWHHSVFRLVDGAVQHGPATAPQPLFATEVVDGRVLATARRP